MGGFANSAYGTQGKKNNAFDARVLNIYENACAVHYFCRLEHEYSIKEDTELAKYSQLDWWDGFDLNGSFYKHYFRGKII
jgi:hypothetical protein